MYIATCMSGFFPLVAIVLIASGCTQKPVLGYGAEPTTSLYTEPKQSGLKAMKPYPDKEGVCVTLEENKAFRKLNSDSALLIACPKHEKGAIDDRVEEAATIIAHAKHWSILAVPN